MYFTSMRLHQESAGGTLVDVINPIGSSTSAATHNARGADRDADRRPRRVQRQVYTQADMDDTAERVLEVWDQRPTDSEIGATR